MSASASSMDVPGFTLHGQVTRGKRLGTRLGFPTANIAMTRKAAPGPERAFTSAWRGYWAKGAVMCAF